LEPTTKPEHEYLEFWLQPGDIIDSDDPAIRSLAESITTGLAGDAERARAIFYWVRDRIRYNMLAPIDRPEHYRPAATVARGEGYCVQKSALMTGLLRAAGIPARMVFATFINHQLRREVYDMLGTNRFVYHGFVELFVEGRWIRATPVFDPDVCERMDMKTVEFDGRSTSVLHPVDRKGRPHIEYVEEHGIYHDVPYDEIMTVFARVYPMDKIDPETLAELE